jgi:hypothetical protein
MQLTYEEITRINNSSSNLEWYYYAGMSQWEHTKLMDAVKVLEDIGLAQKRRAEEHNV